MKKRLFGISILALGVLAMTSCGNGSNANVPAPEYGNKITKGNSVDSITLKIKDNQGVSQDVTISKNDKYDVMMQKLNHNTFTVIGKDETDFHPYVESVSRDNTYEKTNYYSRKITKKPNGEYEELDEYTSGNTKEIYSISANSTVYQYKGAGDLLFYIGNRSINDSFDYNLASGNVSKANNQSYLNKGSYLKYTGSTNNGSMEYATNREDFYSGLYFENSVPDNIKKDYEGLYFTAGSEEFNRPNTRYKAESYDMYFNISNITSYGIYPQTYGYNPNYYGDYLYCNTLQMHTGNLSYVPETLHKYYEFSYELTDKYIIIKNKINASEIALNMIMESGQLSESELNEILKPYNGSYTYQEVWVDYKNYEELSKNYNYPRMGYAYSKFDYVDKRNVSGTWSSNDRLYDIDNATLESLGLIGKTWTSTDNNETHYETYIIDVDDNTINNKKTEFINKCKQNNFFEKYKFTKVAN